MNKSLLERFAIESKIELTKKIENKIKALYINEEFDIRRNGEIYILSNENHHLSFVTEDYRKREMLIEKIDELGIESVVEKATFTWFNRIIALRYMELHDYIPLTENNLNLGIKVLSSRENTVDPEIMKFTNLINPELDINFDRDFFVKLDDEDKKYKYVLLLICKKLGKVIPQIFGEATNYIDILMPDNMLNESGFISKLIKDIPIENFEHVEVIGWFYQYYNQNEKNKAMSRKGAYQKNEIPYVTQLFTPDWIVKYMVENSLGRYFIENISNADLSIADNWKYLIKDNIIQKSNNVNIEKITFIDPCCGSGHILVYAFEVFYEIYKYLGYNIKDVPSLILKNNLYGLDIDERASQLSILSLLLKAREYDKDIFNNDITKEVKIMSFQEADFYDEGMLDELNYKNREMAKYLLDKFKDAKEVGSLIKIKHNDYSSLVEEIENSNNIYGNILRKKIFPLIELANILSQKYNIVATNPPYLNSNVMTNTLKKYLSKYYSESKTDLCTAFMEINIVSPDGYLAMINQHSWMFLSSFEKLRTRIIKNNNIVSMIHLGTRAFEEIGGEVVQTTAFVMEKKKSMNNSLFVRLVDINSANQKEKKFLSVIKENKYYRTEIDNFSIIPGTPFAYWISDKYFDIFQRSKTLGELIPIKQGIATADNNRFLRLWFEVNSENETLNFNTYEEAKKAKTKWFPYNKGGSFRKWYGNNDYVVDWENNGKEIKNFTDDKGKLRSRPQNLEYIFRKSVTWSLISTGDIAFRAKPFGHIFDIAGMSCFPDEKNFNYILALNNSVVINEIMKFIAPTLNYQVGDIAKIPVIFDEKLKTKIDDIVKENIMISKEDWDSYEISWDFSKHPLIKCMEDLKYAVTDEDFKIRNLFKIWNLKCNQMFDTVKNNEQEINKAFIDIYGLQDELKPEVMNKDITIRKADKVREIKSLISYAVGCMFGRYSLDEDGLVFAGGKFDKDRYKKFNVNNDNIILISDEICFDNDIVQRFMQFISAAFGKNTLNENLDFIAETLGRKGTETNEETIRRYFVNDFYKDHVKMYQKRPIYWILDSGKKNGFKALIYIHRYDENLIPKARLDYLHKVQTIYEKLLSDMNYKLTAKLSLEDKKEVQKRQANLNAKIHEIKEYDEKIAHIANHRTNINMDDGVKANYEKFKDILAKIQ